MRKDEPVGGAPRSGWKPVLGLSDEPRDQVAGPDWRDWASRTLPGTVFDQPEPEQLIELTVIVPARNEQDCLGCASGPW